MIYINHKKPERSEYYATLRILQRNSGYTVCMNEWMDETKYIKSASP